MNWVLANVFQEITFLGPRFDLIDQLILELREQLSRPWDNPYPKPKEGDPSIFTYAFPLFLATKDGQLHFRPHRAFLLYRLVQEEERRQDLIASNLCSILPFDLAKLVLQFTPSEFWFLDYESMKPWVKAIVRDRDLVSGLEAMEGLIGWADSSSLTDPTEETRKAYEQLARTRIRFFHDETRQLIPRFYTQGTEHLVLFPPDLSPAEEIAKMKGNYQTADGIPKPQ